MFYGIILTEKEWDIPLFRVYIKGGEYMNKIERYVLDTYESAINNLEYAIYHIEYKKNHSDAVLRLYIEPLDPDKKMDISACETVSRMLSTALDEDDNLPLKDAYNLEVSSPGLERELYNLEHYHRFINEKVRVRLYKSIDGQKEFIGILENVGDEDIMLSIDSKTIKIHFNDISKTQLYCDF